MRRPSTDEAVDLVVAARRDPELVVLEGVHAVKHAVRFGAVLAVTVSPDPAAAAALLARLAPDVGLPRDTVALDDPRWALVAPHGLPSPLLAVARRPVDSLTAVLARADGRPVVVLEGPTHLGNVGAAVRVAAAADAAAVVVVGDADPWHPTAVRGGAGCQFALPVGRRDGLPDGPRPLVAVDPTGADGPVPPGALLAFGTERHGLSASLLDRADLRLALPMRPGVSSLNLATAVSATLYRHVVPR